MQKSNSGFYSAIAVILVLASFLYAWKFLVPDYQKTQTELAKTNREIDSMRIKLESLNMAKTSMDSMGDTVNKLFLSIPGDKDSPNLITELEAIATKAKTYMPSISISDGSAAAAAVASAAPTSNAITVSFTVNGAFGDLNQLITDLEKDIRFTNIRSITYTYDKKSQANSLALQLDVYKRATPVPVTSGLTSAGALNTSGASQ
jgi:Tfp pilus assembly protein PilO